MTPRVEAVTLPNTATAHDVIECAVMSGYSRFPVLGDDIDDVRGVVHVKAAYAIEVPRRASTAITSLMTPIMHVPETTGVDALLPLLRDRGNQMAVVVDEYGGTAGVITLEDLVEELLGDVQDEHDRPVDGIIREEGALTFPGSMRPDELWEQVAIRIPESEDYDTVAGFILDALDRVPRVGETVDLDRGLLHVERVDGSRIERLRYTSHNEDEDPAFAGSHERMLDTLRNETDQ